MIDLGISVWCEAAEIPRLLVDGAVDEAVEARYAGFYKQLSGRSCLDH